MAQVESTRMVTPEAVALEFRTANIGSRILAFFLDWLVVGAGIVVLLLAIALIGSVAGSDLPEWLGLALVLVLLPCWYLGYFIAFETLWRGRTLGKAALGLRVVTREGAPVRFRHAAVRALVGLVDFYLGLGFFAVVFILFSRNNQRLGDLAAGTLVVRERRAPLPAAPPTAPDFAVADRYAAWDVSGVTSFELVTVRRFLERRWQLDPSARGRLGWELAERLRPKVAGAPPDLHPEQFLEGLATAKAARG